MVSRSPARTGSARGGGQLACEYMVTFPDHKSRELAFAQMKAMVAVAGEIDRSVGLDVGGVRVDEVGVVALWGVALVCGLLGRYAIGQHALHAAMGLEITSRLRYE